MGNVRTSQGQSFAEKSFQNFQSHWVTFLKFCICFSRVAFPVDDVTLMGFAQFTSEHVKSSKTVRAAISAVRKLQQFMGFPIKAFFTFKLGITLRGIDRACTHVTKQARPMTPELLISIYHRLDMEDFNDAIFWLTCIMAFFLLLRKSNLLPTTIHRVSAKQTVNVGGFVFHLA